MTRKVLPFLLAGAFASALGAEPHDRYQLQGTERVASVRLPEKDLDAEGTLFLPTDVRRVQLVIVVIKYGLGDTAIYGDPQWRQFCEKHEVGLLHLRISNASASSTARVWSNAQLGGADALVQVLQRLAQANGISSISGAPLLFWGHSAAGPFGSTFAAMYPERTLAVVRYHSGGVTGDIDAIKHIPTLFFIGGKDTNFPNAKLAAEELWLQGRQRNAPWTWAVEPDATHGVGSDVVKANALMIPWVAAVMRQRQAVNGTGLRVLTADEAWFGSLSSASVAASGRFGDTTSPANWLPDEAAARAWQTMVGSSKK